MQSAPGHLASAVLSVLGQTNGDFCDIARAIPCGRADDIDCSGSVDGVDLGILLSRWGPVP